MKITLNQKEFTDILVAFLRSNTSRELPVAFHDVAANYTYTADNDGRITDLGVTIEFQEPKSTNLKTTN